MTSKSSTGVPPDYLFDDLTKVESGSNNDNKDNKYNGSTNYVSMDDMDRTMDDCSFSKPSQPHRNQEVDDDDDDDDDGNSISPSIVRSVLSADGIHDTTGFACVCLVMLLGDMNRGVFFPSLWPLVEYLGGNTVILGYAVAGFSFGRIIVNPIFGSWSHSMGYTKTLLLATVILLVGTIMYSQVCHVGTPAFLILTQTVLGIGSGTLGVTRGFVADVTAKRHRTTYMAWITAVQYAGFTVTPILGAMFNWIYRAHEYSDTNWIEINMFTAPAYFMAASCIFTLVILMVYFRDRQRIATHTEYKRTRKQREVDEIVNAVTFTGLSIYDCCIVGCMLLNLPPSGSIAVFETIGIAVAESNFDMVSSRAGLLVGFCGTLGVIALLQMGRLSLIFSDVHLIGGGMLAMGIGVFLLSSLDEEDGAFNPTWKFVLSIFFVYSIGYPIGHTAIVGLFSKSTFSLIGLYVKRRFF